MTAKYGSPPSRSVGEMQSREVRAGTGDFEESLVFREHLNGVPEPDCVRPGGSGGHHGSLESVGRISAHDDRRRLGLRAAESVGNLHGVTDRDVPLLVVGRPLRPGSRPAAETQSARSVSALGRVPAKFRAPHSS